MKPDVLLLLRLPEDLKAGKVPLVHAEVGAADDVAPIELQAGLEADAAVLRHRQRLQTLAIDFSAQGPHLQGARGGTGRARGGSDQAQTTATTAGTLLSEGVTFISYLSALRRMWSPGLCTTDSTSLFWSST